MNETIVSVRHLKKYYEARSHLRSAFSRPKTNFNVVKAVDDVSFDICKGEILSLVGESGSGKTTTAQLIVRAIEPTAGSIWFNGKDLAKLSGDNLRKLRQKLQMIYQDPFDSIDPRFKVFDVVCEGVLAHSLATSGQELNQMAKKILEKVGLTPPEEFMNRFPHQLSGGQRQRVAFARAAILYPELVVADEPVSMLDVSIKAEVLNSMLRLRTEDGISFMFVTHDLAWARHVADRIAVMYLGKMVEIASADEIVRNTLHPYTQALIVATPIPDPTAGRPKVMAQGEIPSAVDVPSGCSFHPRCPYAFDRCKRETPALLETTSGHWVSCHLVNK